MRAISWIGISLAAALMPGIGGCALFFDSRLDGLAVTRLERLGPVADVEVQASSGWMTTFDRQGVYATELVAVDFTSEKNLRVFATDNDYAVSAETTFCRGDGLDPSRPLQDSVYVYDTAGKVLPSYSVDVAVSTYRVYVAVKSTPLAGQQTYGYDLHSAPTDICIRLRGGNMLGASYKSDVLVIPAASIRAALAHSEVH